MKEKLLELLNNSYSPYSNYAVSAILVTKDGKGFYGVNVENASYGAAICAERSAIVSAISAGYKRYDFKELYVMCDSPKISSSCFICRQLIQEFFEEDDKIIEQIKEMLTEIGNRAKIDFNISEEETILEENSVSVINQEALKQKRIFNQ